MAKTKGYASIIDLILRIIIYAAIIYAIIAIIEKILGHSFDSGDIALMIVIGIGAEMLRIERSLGTIEGRSEGKSSKRKRK